MLLKYNFLEILFAIIGSFLFVTYPISVFTSYKYVKKNLSSICNLLFGDPGYYKTLDWSNHFLIEMAIGTFAALKFRELKVLKRSKIFSKGYLPLAPNLDDTNIHLLIKNHGGWYKSVVRNLLISSTCMLILAIIIIIFKNP